MSNNNKYKLSLQPYIVLINPETIVIKIKKTVPNFPDHNISPHNDNWLIHSATADTYLQGILSLIDKKKQAKHINQTQM